MNGKKSTHEGSHKKYMLKRHYHDCSYGWKLLWVINTGFNFTHRLSQLGEEYFSLVHLHTPIYCTLALFTFETSSTSLDADITILDALSTPHIFWCIFVLQYLSIFISTNTFGVLCVIHAWEQMSSQLCTIFTIWISLEVFYEGQVFTTCWERTVVSSTNLQDKWNVSVKHTPLLSWWCLDLLVHWLLCRFLQSIPINNLCFF